MKTWKKYKFETLFIKKSNLKHENTCLKHDLWKISSPTVSPKGIVQCSFPGALAPCELKLWPRLHTVGKNTRVLMKHPWGECKQTPCGLSPWADEMWVNRVGCCDDPCTPRDLNNSHTCQPTYPNIRPKDLVPQGIAAPPQGGVNRHLMLQPPEATWARVKFASAMAPEDDHNTDSLVWRLGMV